MSFPRRRESSRDRTLFCPYIPCGVDSPQSTPKIPGFGETGLPKTLRIENQES